MKTSKLLFLLCAFFGIITSAYAETESNNSWQTANVVVVGSDISGNLGVANDNEDWFAITLPKYGELKVWGIPDATLDLSIDIYDVNGTNWVGDRYWNKDIGVTDSTRHTHLKAGTYYIKIWNASGYGSYTLKNKFTPTGLPDGNDTEPNDDFGKAITAVINIQNTGNLGYFSNGLTDNDDWYKITLPYAGQLKLWGNIDPTLDLSIDIYDVNGTSWIGDRYWNKDIGVADSTRHTHLKAGTYYIKIWNASGYGSYMLKNKFTPTGLPDGNDTEPNDDFGKAITTVINIQNTGHLGYYSNGLTDNDDWYKITLPYDGQLKVWGDIDQTLDLSIDIYDGNGTRWIGDRYSNTEIGIPDSTRHTHLKAGTYYIKTWNASGYGSYTLKSKFTPTGIPNGNDTEINDDYTKAITLTYNTSATGHIGYYRNDSTDADDWYKITIPNDGQLKICGIPDATLNIGINIYNTNGTSWIGDRYTNLGTGLTDTTRHTNLKAGTYFVKIWSDGGYGSYTLINKFIPTGIPTGNDAEPNDDYTKAIPLTYNTSATGHIGYYRNDSTDADDWYKIILQNDGQLKVWGIPDVTLNIGIDIYNTNGTSWIGDRFTNLGTGLTDSTRNTNLKAGTYYIKIWSDGGYGSYTLNSKFTILSPKISAVPSSIQFGELAIGGNSAKTLNIMNTGDADLAISKITVPGGYGLYDRWGRDASTISYTVTSGNAEIFYLKFIPSEVKTYFGNISISSNDSNTPMANVAVSGTGTAVATGDIYLNPTTIDFGNVKSNTISDTTKYIRIANRSTGIFELKSITATGAFEFKWGDHGNWTQSYGPFAAPWNWAKGDSNEIYVRFKPGEIKSYSGNITISTNISGKEAIIIPLTGTGTSIIGPEIAIDPISLPFVSTNVGYMTSNSTVTISNTGSSELSISSISIISGFEIWDGSTWGTTIGAITISAGSSYAVYARFKPSEVKSYSGNLVIKSNDSDEATVNVAVSGIGTTLQSTPEIEIVNYINPFGDVLTGDFSIWGSFTIKNTGNGVLNVSSIAVPDGFIILNSSGSWVNNITAFTISAGFSQAFYVRFNPSLAQSYTGNLSISSNDADEPTFLLALSGKGVASITTSESENNNTYGSANIIGNGYSVTGTIGYSGDTEDWYKIVLTTDGKLVITETTSTDLWSGIYLYDADGTNQFSWSEATKNGVDELTYNNLGAGTYYIKILNWGNGQGPYTLKVNDYPAELPIDIEKNDTYSQANLISPNSSTTGHVGYYSNKFTDTEDWYKIFIPSDGKLEIIEDCRIDLWSGIYLYDADGTHQVTWSEALKNGIDTLIYSNLMAGTYYIKILNWGNGYGEYKLTANHYPAEFTNDQEPNNTSSTAVSLTLNNSTTGHIGFYTNQTTDTEDWYKITTSSAGKFLIVETTTVDLWSGITVYKSDMSNTGWSEALKGGADTLVIDNLPAGDYYIKIYNWGNGFGSYTLKMEVAKPFDPLAPMAYYPFNGNANDESGNGRNGVNYGAILTTDRFGQPNKAYYFNGTGNYINIPGTNSLHLTSGFSLCAWVNFTEASTFHAIVGKHISGYGNGYYLQIRPATHPEFFVSSELGLQTPNAINDGNWHFLAGIYDGTTMKLYVDGILSLNQSKAYTSTNDSTILIGKHHQGVAADWFNGKIDDISIYNRVLSENELQLLFKEGGYNEVSETFTDQFVVYPNPTDGIINIKSVNNEMPNCFEIYDINGRLYNTSNYKQLNGKIDLSGLQKGLYILKFINKNKVVTTRIILQ